MSDTESDVEGKEPFREGDGSFSEEDDDNQQNVCLLMPVKDHNVDNREQEELAAANLQLLANLASDAPREVHRVRFEDEVLNFQPQSELEQIMSKFQQQQKTMIESIERLNKENQKKFEDALVTGMSKVAEIRYGGQAERFYNATRLDNLAEREEMIVMARSLLLHYKADIDKKAKC